MRKVKITAFILCMALCLSACGAKEEKNAGEDLKQKIANQKKADMRKPGTKADNATAEDVQPSHADADLSSEDAIRAFLAGEWGFTDLETGEDYATVTFAEDGSLTFMRLSDQASCTGTIGFERNYSGEAESLDYFNLELNGIADLVSDDLSTEPDESCDTSGKFYIGCGETEDYLFLNEIGNGDTWISLEVFNIHKDDPGGKWAQWMFHRRHDAGQKAAASASDDFYAWVWQKDGNSVFLQKMIPHTYDTFGEYSDTAFTAAYFTEEEDPAVIEYQLDAGVDTSGFYDEKTWNSMFPLDMYKIKTDGNGTIKQVSEVDKAFYGIYDFGELEPDFYSEQRMFYCNNASYDMEDIAPAITAIMDCTKAGEWIVVEGHVNPHRSIYSFFNLRTGYFEYEVVGTNLIWRDNNIATAVYASDNEVRDIFGNLVGFADEGEVYNLRFKDDQTIEAEYMLIENGVEKNFTKEFEYEAPDTALFAYYEYLLTWSARDWREFAAMAPDGADAFLLVDPPEFVLNRMGPPYEYEKGALDTIAVVALKDDLKLHIEADEPGASGKGKRYDFDLSKKDNQVIQVTAPEGMPMDNLVINTKDNKEIIWPIMPLSGRIVQKSTFLTE